MQELLINVQVCITCLLTKTIVKMILDIRIICTIMGRYAHYGNLRDGFKYYPDKRDLVEVSDTVYFDRQLLQLQCSLA